VTISKLTPAFATFPLAFKCPVDAADGKIEITATGSGALRIGAVSLMPSDNIQGWRREVIEVLKSFAIGSLSLAGRELRVRHEWRDAIGDPDLRPPTWDPVWRVSAVKRCRYDEFMALCRLTVSNRTSP